MHRLLAFLLVLSLPFMATAQSSRLGNWLIYVGSKKIDSRWNWHHEIQYRNYNAIGDLEQLLLRTGIGYNLSERNNNLLLGYGFIHSQNYLPNAEEKESVNEHRICQQFITRQDIGRVKVEHRYRFEQRWIADQKVKFRFRYFLGLNVPLNHTDLTEQTWYLSAYNEVFLNHKATVFDRNRLYGGIGYKLNSLARFELGYMNQFFSEGGRDQINMVVLFSF